MKVKDKAFEECLKKVLEKEIIILENEKETSKIRMEIANLWIEYNEKENEKQNWNYWETIYKQYLKKIETCDQQINLKSKLINNL